MRKNLTRFGGLLVALALALSSASSWAQTNALRLTDQVINSSGRPIVNGYIYIGAYQQDPVANPLSLFSDPGLTTPIANPQRTDSFGRPVNDIYVAEPRYSYQLKDSVGVSIEGPKNRIASASATSVVRQVATIAALKAITGMVDGQVADVACYYSCATPDGGGGRFRYDAASAASDNGGTTIDPTVAGNGRWLRIYTGGVYLKWFGAKGDGTADDIAARDSAVTALTASGGTLFGERKDTYKFSTGITIPSGVVLDFQNAVVKPSANVDLFTLRENGLLKNVRVDATAIAYSSTVVKLSPAQNYRGGEWSQPWVENYEGKLTQGAGNGTHILFDASSFTIQEAVLDNIACYHGENAIKHTAGAAKFSNGNIVKGLVAHDPVYSILETTGGGEIAGNVYYTMLENNTENAQIQLNTRSIVHGAMFDRVKVTFKGNENIIIGAPLLLEDDFVDEGIGNRITGTDVSYYDGRSVQVYGDWRNANTLPGMIEFRDFFVAGALDSRWLVTGTGATSFSTITSAGVNLELSRARARLDTGTTLNDTRQMTWAVSSIKTGHSPRLHATVQTAGTANEKQRIGFWADANNNIIFESDQANTRWLAKTCNAGACTTTNISTNFNRLIWLSIVATNTEVKFYHGNAAFGNDAVAQGINNITLAATHTTNIPKGVFMGPLAYVETLNGGSAAGLLLYDFQVLQTVNAVKP